MATPANIHHVVGHDLVHWATFENPPVYCDNVEIFTRIILAPGFERPIFLITRSPGNRQISFERVKRTPRHETRLFRVRAA